MRGRDSRPDDSPDGQDSPELGNIALSAALVDDSEKSGPAEGAEYGKMVTFDGR